MLNGNILHADPAATTEAFPHFEVASATLTMRLDLSFGATLAMLVYMLIEAY